MRSNLSDKDKPMIRYGVYISTVTSKGQVTIPAAVRHVLGVSTADKLVFRIVDGKVEVEPSLMRLDEAFGSVKPLNTPEDFAEIDRVAKQEREALARTAKG